jgi:hypothetical protein
MPNQGSNKMSVPTHRLQVKICDGSILLLIFSNLSYLSPQKTVFQSGSYLNIISAMVSKYGKKGNSRVGFIEISGSIFTHHLCESIASVYETLFLVLLLGRTRVVCPVYAHRKRATGLGPFRVNSGIITLR